MFSAWNFLCYKGTFWRQKIKIHTNFLKCYNFTIIKAQQTYSLVIYSLLNDVISNSRAYSHLMAGWLVKMRWKRYARYCSLIWNAILPFTLKGRGKPWQTSTRKITVLAKNRTGNIPNTSQGCHCFRKLVLFELEFPQQTFKQSTNIIFHENPSSGSRWDRWTWWS